MKRETGIGSDVGCRDDPMWSPCRRGVDESRAMHQFAPTGPTHYVVQPACGNSTSGKVFSMPLSQDFPGFQPLPRLYERTTQFKGHGRSVPGHIRQSQV